MVRDDRLAAPERIAGRALQITADTCVPDDTLAPAHARAHHERHFAREVFQHLREARVQALGGNNTCFVEDLLKAVGLHRKPPELGDDLLLPEAQIEIANRKVCGNTIHHIHINVYSGVFNCREALLVWQTDSALRTYAERVYGHQISRHALLKCGNQCCRELALLPCRCRKTDARASLGDG